METFRDIKQFLFRFDIRYQGNLRRRSIANFAFELP